MAQLAVQGLGLAAGLVLANLMPVREYALYALALSILSFVSLASDPGISNALLYLRRETYIRRTSFQPYVRAALRMRRILLVAGFCVAALLMWHVATLRGFDSNEVYLALAIVAVALWLHVHASLDILLLRLAQAYRATYIAETAGNGFRLIGSIAIALSSLTTSWAGLAIGAFGALFTRLLSARAYGLLRRETETPARARAPSRDIMRYVVPTAANTVYVALQAPLLVWLSGYFGNAGTMAEVGALGRLSILFSVLLGFASAVILPRLAGVTDESSYRRRCIACWAVLIPAGLALLGAAAALPHWLLWLLGPNYVTLERELMLVVLTAAINLWGGFAMAVNSARGWVRWHTAMLLPHLFAQIALVVFLDLSTSYGVLLFGMCSAVTGSALALVNNVIGFVRPDYVTVNNGRNFTGAVGAERRIEIDV